MVLQMYAVRDCKAEVYHVPFYSHNVRDAMRKFHRMLQEVEIFKGYEEDYSMWHIGTYDDKLGLVNGLDIGPNFIISANACLGKETAESEADSA